MRTHVRSSWRRGYTYCGKRSKPNHVVSPRGMMDLLKGYSIEEVANLCAKCAESRFGLGTVVWTAREGRPLPDHLRRYLL